MRRLLNSIYYWAVVGLMLLGGLLVIAVIFKTLKYWLD